MEKTLKLLSDRHSDDLLARHLQSVKKLVSAHKQGFLLKDVITLTDILKRCTGKIETSSKYEDMICMLVHRLSVPMLMENSSDEKHYISDAVTCFIQLGHIAETCASKVKVSVATSIAKLYVYKVEHWDSLDLKPVPTTFIRSLISRSQICKSISNCMLDVPNEKHKIIRALLTLSDSPLNCDDILSAGGASVLSSFLKPGQGYYDMFTIVETIWNLLENGSIEQLQQQLGCAECISSLKEAFVFQMQNCTSHADRQLRNDLLTISTLIASKCPNAPFTETGFTEVIATYTAWPEVASRSLLLEGHRLEKCPEDFELKKLLFNMIAMLTSDTRCHDKDAFRCFAEKQVPLALFSYVRPINSELTTTYALAEFEELQLQALSVLATLAPGCVESYVTCQGSTRILLMIEWCIENQDFGGHGNSLYGEGGRGSKRAQLRFCIRLLRSITSLDDQNLIQDLVDQGALPQFIAILDACSLSPAPENDKIDVEIQSDMLLILAALCDGEEHRKELFGEAGVTMLLQYLMSYTKSISNPLGQRKLILAAVHCIWCCVFGCFNNESIFLEREGIYLLLDLCEACSPNMRSAVLGTLIDLTENAKTLVHVMEWRGKDEITAAKLLVSFWIEEEKSMEVERLDHGIIGETSRPLLTKSQSEHGVLSLPSHVQTPAILDIGDNLRAKIFSMFCKIGFNNVPGLVSQDYISVAIIEKYMCFKTLEVWCELQVELQLERIKLVSPDQECMSEIIKLLTETSEHVKKVQALLVTAGDNQVLSEEQDFYKKIKEGYTHEMRRYQEFMNYVERTSNPVALKKARQMQLEAIDHSRLVSRGNPLNTAEKSHETIETRLQTTQFPGRSLQVTSTDLGSLLPSAYQLEVA